MEIILFMLVIVALGILALHQGYDPDGTIQDNQRMRRKRHRYRRKNDLPWGAPTPWDD